MHKHSAPPSFYFALVSLAVSFWQSLNGLQIERACAPDVSLPTMSCQSFHPFSFTGAEAGGLASPPCSASSPEHCEEHGESLSVFCLDDLEPVCKQCAAVSHAGHRVYLLTEAADDCKVGISRRDSSSRTLSLFYERSHFSPLRSVIIIKPDYTLLYH